MVSPADKTLTVTELQNVGVKRISLGVALYTHAMASLQEAASALVGGDLASASSGMSFARVTKLLAKVTNLRFCSGNSGQ